MGDVVLQDKYWSEGEYDYKLRVYSKTGHFTVTTGGEEKDVIRQVVKDNDGVTGIISLGYQYHGPSLNQLTLTIDVFECTEEATATSVKRVDGMEWDDVMQLGDLPLFDLLAVAMMRDKIKSGYQRVDWMTKEQSQGSIDVIKEWVGAAKAAMPPTPISNDISHV